MKRPHVLGAVLGALVGTFWVAVVISEMAKVYPVDKEWSAILLPAIHLPHPDAGVWVALMFGTCPTVELIWIKWWLVPASNALLYAVIFAAASGWIQSRGH
jgi:hypothetical protein